MNCDELLNSCEQVRNMAQNIRSDIQRSNNMTQEIDHLFNDLFFTIKNCEKYAQQYLISL